MVKKIITEKHPEIKISEHEQGYLWFLKKEDFEHEIQFEMSCEEFGNTFFLFSVETSEHHLRAHVRSVNEVVQ